MVFSSHRAGKCKSFLGFLAIASVDLCRAYKMLMDNHVISMFILVFFFP